MLKVKIPTGLVHRIRLAYDYTETDFLKCIKRKLKRELVEKFEDNFSYFQCDNSGMLIELSEITNLNNDSFVFLFHDKFCEENLLVRLKEIGRFLYAPAIVFSGIYCLNDLLEKIKDKKYRNNLGKILGEDVQGLISRLKK